MNFYLLNALIYFLLFLLTCGLFCGHVCVSGNETPQAPAAETNFIDLFKKETISGAQKPKDEDSVADGVGVNDYHSLALVSTNKALVALAGVNRTSKEGKSITVLTNCIGIESGNSWGNDVIANTDSKWKKQFAVYEECKSDACVSDNSVVRGLAAAVKEDKIYLFFANFSTQSQENSWPGTGSKWWFGFVVGDATQKEPGKPIKWKEEETLKLSDTSQFTDILKKELSDPHLFDCYAFAIEGKKIVFIVKSTLKNSAGADGNEKIAAFFLFNEEDSKQLELLNVDSSKNGYPNFFQWKGKIFKVPTDDSTEGSGNNMMEFKVTEKKFENTNDPVARLNNFLKDKQNFVTATIQDKGTVLLFTQLKHVKSAMKNVVDLWMTDGARVSRVDTIFPDIKGTFYASLLHTNSELFVLHQDYQQSNPQDSNNKITLTRLNKQLEHIKNILDAWKQNDETIKEGCKDANKQNSSCAPPLPIAGLVGFLNSIVTENEITIWKDEYHYLNATVKKEKSQKVENGFEFSGAGAGARWPVGEQSLDQPYNFKDSGFTLVAAVTVGSGGTNGKDNSILGVGLTGDSRNAVGLWCTNDNKWALRVEKNGQLKKSEEECKQGATYNVVFVLNKNGNLEIYVNGKKTAFLGNAIKIQNNEKITHFYFGADTDRQGSLTDESYVTVTHVFLYNRPFEDTDINKLKEYLKPVEVTKSTGNNTNTTGSGSDPQTPTQPPDPTKEAKDDGTLSPSHTEDGDVGGGVRVFFLLLAVLCVSAPLLHL